jgi:hypothetical protein
MIMMLLITQISIISRLGQQGCSPCFVYQKLAHFSVR